MFGGPAWLMARAEWRQRGRALVLVALIAWLTITVSVAAFSASRRAGTSFDRLLVATNTPTLEGFAPEGVDPDDFAALADVPGVEAGALGTMFVVGPKNSELVAGANVIGAALEHPIGAGAIGGLTLAGRLPDPSRIDEIAVNAPFVEATGLGAGDELDLVSITDEQMDVAEQRGDFPEVPDGPEVRVRIAAVVRMVEDVSDRPEPVILLTPAFAERYRSEIAAFGDIVMLRVRPERIPDVQAVINERFGDALSLDRAEDFGARVRDGIAVQKIALLVFAAVAGFAGLLATAQNLRRFTALGLAQRQSLQAIGASRRLLDTASAIVLAPAGIVAVLVGCATSVAVAPALVTGLARAAEPDPGAWFDLTALGLGAVWSFVGLAVVAAITDRLVARAPAGRSRGSIAEGAARRLRLGAGAATGLRFALDPGRDVGGLPTRSAIMGAAVGITGIVATITFTASVAGLFDRPADWGAHFDVLLTAPEDLDEAVRLAEDLAGEDGVRAVALNEYVEFGKISTRDETFPVEFEAVRAIDGTIPFSIVDGRPPQGEDEMIVGPAVLDMLGVGIGSKVVVETDDGDAVRTIVGTVVAPGVDDVDRSAYMTPEGLANAGGEHVAGSSILLATDGSVSADELAARLKPDHPSAEPVPAPGSIDNLDEFGSLPLLLAAFLAALSVIAALAAVVLTVRRRRKELAILRAIGFVRRQVGEAVVSQALVLATAGVAVGVPLGVFAGRAVYGTVGHGIGFLVTPTLPVSGVAVVVGAAALAALVIAAVVAPAAQRLGLAATLRAE